MAPTKRIQPLDPELVNHRGRFPLNKVSLSVKDLDSAILLWQFPGSLKIESAKWQEDGIERRERRIHTMGDLFEATKQEAFLSLGQPNLDVCTLKGDPCEKFNITVRGLPNDSFSIESQLGMMRVWAKDCSSHHSECLVKETFLPRRTLRIEGTVAKPIVRLELHDSMVGTYVALSYCWGINMHPLSTLTTDQYELFKDNINFLRLSKTYQDAIATTLALGVHHIWIDALCIIQNSPEDWNEESQKMGQYYGNAHLTICVASADDVHAGFRTRSPGLYEPLHLRQHFPSGEVGNLLISRGIHDYHSWISKGVRYSFGLWQANVEVCQLASRAWVLQERLLSPRKIHFGKENIFWECRRSRHAEGGESSLGGQTSGLTDMAASLARKDLTVQDWYDLVEMYTARRLTRQSDRLRAIAGLAVPFKGVLQEDYVAGLWTHDLHYGLNWRLEGGALHGQDAKALFPSWSWASSCGPVCFGEPHTDAESEEKTALKLRSVSGRTPNDPYGATSQMHLHLTGCLRRTTLRQEEPLSLFASDDIKGRETSTAANGAVGTYFDDGSLPRHGEHFWTLQLCDVRPTAGPSIPMSYHVIVMEAVDDQKGGETCFRRIGAALVFHDLWFKGCTDQAFTLI